MATENIMMEAVKRGGDRQELHEAIRVHSMEAGKQVKMYGNKNDLIERIAGDELFGLSLEELKAVLNPKNYIGRAPEQVEDFYKMRMSSLFWIKNDIKDLKVDLKV